MKRNIERHVKYNARQLKEDLFELQRLMRHRSVYAKHSIRDYTRRPKHRKQQFEYHEIAYLN